MSLINSESVTKVTIKQNDHVKKSEITDKLLHSFSKMLDKDNMIFQESERIFLIKLSLIADKIISEKKVFQTA